MKMNKFLHTLESCWLCLKYPFLYPRNRFTNKHKVNILHKSLYNLYHKSICEITLTGRLEKERKLFFSYTRFFDTSIKLDKENKKLIISNSKYTEEVSLKRLLWGDNKFDILGISLEFTLAGTPVIIVHTITHDESDKANYGFHFETIKLMTNKFIHTIYKIVKWIDEQIFDRLLFIPTYTELDSMDEGWRKAFGLQMCEDIKKAILKSGGRSYLKRYRILQIKEKYGQLRWYDNGSTKEVDDVISKYEYLSENTCIICGKPAKWITPYKYWVSPFCNEHIPDRIPKEELIEIKNTI